MEGKITMTTTIILVRGLTTLEVAAAIAAQIIQEAEVAIVDRVTLVVTMTIPIIAGLVTLAAEVMMTRDNDDDEESDNSGSGKGDDDKDDD